MNSLLINRRDTHRGEAKGLGNYKAGNDSDMKAHQGSVSTYLAALEEHEREQQNRQLEEAQRDTDSSPPGSSIPASLISAVSQFDCTFAST